METALPITDPRQRKVYYFHTTLVRRVAKAILSVLFTFIARIEISGLENLPDRGAVILAANHLTNFDVFPMSLAIERQIFFMGKEELFRHPVLDWFLRKLGGFPVYRGANDAWALQHAGRVLEHQQVLGIFPEGKRSKGSGMRPGKSGVARLAIQSGAPIVPVAVNGTQYMFRHFPRRTRITLILGKPIYPRPDESQLALTDRVMYAIADMLPPEARGVYARRPQGF